MNTRQNPYVGPRAFQPGEPFYGRDRELRSLTALLIAERIVLLHSPSGSGKTSLIQAGLLPRLRQQDFNVLPIIRVNAEIPEGLGGVKGVNRYTLSVILSLEENLPEAERRPVSELAALTLDSYLTHRPRLADTPISDVLVFDQFEEVITYAATDRESKLIFFEQLGNALRNKDRWALFAIREDYLGALAPYTRPIPGRLTATFRLDLLGVDGALQAIQKPAQVSSVSFLSSAASKLADDLRRIQVQLPDGNLEDQLGPNIEPVQLQVVCYRLWQGLTDDDIEIDEGDLAGVGDVNRALADYYAASVANVAQKSDTSERVIREWFDSKLITREGIRGQVLMGAEQSDGLPNRTVNLLEDAHIIRGEKRAGKTWFELSHDRMIKPIRENNAIWFSANLSLFQQQAVLWAAQGRPDGLLLRGKPLTQAEDESIALQLNDNENAFLMACHKLRENEQRDKLRTRISQALTLVALIAMMVAIMFGINANKSQVEAENAKSTAILAGNTAEAASIKAISALNTANAASTQAVNEKNQANLSAKIARSGELASLSSYYRDKIFLLALLLGVEAFQGKDTPQARSALFNNANTNLYMRQFLSNHLIRLGTKNFAFSPDGKTFAYGNSNNTITLWDVSTGQPISQSLTGHTNGVLSLAFSPNGKILASGGAENTIILWDLSNTLNTTSQPKHQLLAEHTNTLMGLAFSPDGKTLAAYGDNSVSFWDVSTTMSTNIASEQPKANTFAVDIPSPIDNFVFSPDGKTLALGLETSTDTITFKTWDITTHEPKKQSFFKRGSERFGYLMAVSPDGKTVAFTKQNNDENTNSIVLWNIVTGKTKSQVTEKSINFLVFSPDGKTLASLGSENNIITLWDVATRFTPDSVTDQPNDQLLVVTGVASIRDLTFSPNGETLAIGSDDKTITLWDMKNSVELTDDFDPIVSVAFSPDGKTLASGNYDSMSYTITLWDVPNTLNKSVVTSQPKRQPLSGLTELAYSFVFSTDGKTLISGSGDNSSMLWNLETNPPTNQLLTKHQDDLFDIALSPDGKTLASAGHQDHTLRLWDLTTGQQKGQALAQLPGNATRLAFSPDSKTLAASGNPDHTIGLWDVLTGQPKGQPLVGHTDGVYSLAFSPDGKTLASGSADNTILFWDVTNISTNRPKDQPLIGRNSVGSLAFSPDGKILASGNGDNTIILWDVISHQPIGEPLAKFMSTVSSIAFSPNGKILASGSFDGNVLFWDVDPQSWLEKSCQRAGRNFTRAEWTKYFPGEEYRITCPQWPEEPALAPDPIAVPTPNQ